MLLVIYASSQVLSTYFMSATMDKTQRTIMMIVPLIFITVIANFPAGLVLYWVTTNLWTVGQGLVTRRLVPKTPAPAWPKRTLARPAPAAPARSRRRSGRRRQAGPEGVDAAPAREAEARRRPQMSDEVTVEATGETVGEAKWNALRELERLAPGIDKAAVRFQVVAEGERGLLGVGATPARVLASAAAIETMRTTAAAPIDESPDAARVRLLLEHVTAALGIRCRVDVAESEGALARDLLRWRSGSPHREARPDDRRGADDRERDARARR